MDKLETNRLTWKMWLKNIWDAAITGGCSSALAVGGIAGAHSMGVDVKLLDYKQTGAVFLSGLVLHVLTYLKSHPSPDIGSDVSQTENEKTKS